MVVLGTVTKCLTRRRIEAIKTKLDRAYCGPVIAGGRSRAMFEPGAASLDEVVQRVNVAVDYRLNLSVNSGGSALIPITQSATASRPRYPRPIQASGCPVRRRSGAS